MVDLKFEADILASADRVFSLLADLRDYDRWLPASAAFRGTVRISDGPIAVGTTYLEPGPFGTRRGVVTAMDLPSLDEFVRSMYTDNFDKDGLVIDVRFNGGGFTHDQLLSYLGGKDHTKFVSREGAQGHVMRQNDRKWTKPIVVLLNNRSYSDAEIFPSAFRALGLGNLEAETLDASLRRLALAKEEKLGRPLEQRLTGAMRLLKMQIGSLALQLLLTLGFFILLRRM